jgi:hypothetical protein
MRRVEGLYSSWVLHSISKIEAMRRSDEALNRTITQLMDAVASSSCRITASPLYEPFNSDAHSCLAHI